MKHLRLLVVLLLLAGTSVPAFSFARQGDWRWRNDDGTDVTATWKADENTPFTLTHRDNIRLRVAMANNSDNLGFGPNPIGLGYRYTGQASWSEVTDDSSSNHFVFSESPHFINQAASTEQLQAFPPYSFIEGFLFDTYDSANNYPELSPETLTELEFSIRATPQALDNTEYEFRLYTDSEPYVYMDILEESQPVMLTTAFDVAQVPLSLWGLIFAGLLIIAGSVLIVRRF